MSKRITSRRSSSPARKSVRVRPFGPSGPTRLRVIAQSLPSPSETMWLRARGRSEYDMIASALRDAPVLNREAMGAEPHPFNDVASSQPVQAVIDKLVRQRNAESPWIDAHRALIRTDENGKGYAEYVDAFRDAAFLVGLDYGLRSISGVLPEWLNDLQRADEDLQRNIAVLVRFALKGGTR